MDPRHGGRSINPTRIFQLQASSEASVSPSPTVQQSLPFALYELLIFFIFLLTIAALFCFAGKLKRLLDYLIARCLIRRSSVDSPDPHAHVHGHEIRARAQSSTIETGNASPSLDYIASNMHTAACSSSTSIELPAISVPSRTEGGRRLSAITAADQFASVDNILAALSDDEEEGYTSAE